MKNYLLTFQILLFVCCGLPFTEAKVPTMDDILGTLGRLYQENLYSQRSEVEDNVALAGMFDTRHSSQEAAAETHETQDVKGGRLEEASIHLGNVCFNNNNTCVTVDLTFNSGYHNSPGAKRKEKRDTKGFGDIFFPKKHYAACYKKVRFSSYKIHGSKKAADLSSMTIPDFCLPLHKPGKLSLMGSVTVFTRLTSFSRVTFEFKSVTEDLGLDPVSPITCFGPDRICKVINGCDLLERNCKESEGHEGAFPCHCPLRPNIYNVTDVQYTFPRDFLYPHNQTGNFVGSAELIIGGKVSYYRFGFTRSITKIRG